MVRKVVNALSVLVLVLWFLPKACLEPINPHEIGVRRSLTGGIDEEDFGTGYHVSLPFWHRWYKLQRTIHYLEFSGETGAPLDVRTKENNVIFIDVTVPYRIKDGAGWEIVRAGFDTNYAAKVKSTALGILREHLAQLSNLDVQDPEKRAAITRETLPVLNEALDQYHIEATHVVLRAIAFREQYEGKLQAKQYLIVQGRLDQALQGESVARQETETREKSIDKEVALKEESWNKQIEELKSKFEIEIAEVNAEVVRYQRQRRAEADATYTSAMAEGDLAEALAEALGEKLKAEALSTRAGRTFSAVEAANRFKLGDIRLNSSDPQFLYHFGSMSAWRRFFLGE
jgi:regulator of protease activity HflC (stomatin/prohibitin superfamily)